MEIYSRCEKCGNPCQTEVFELPKTFDRAAPTHDFRSVCCKAPTAPFTGPISASPSKN